ncbi:MAG: maleylpyruvate isomerase family mycothiol-dependent enzyme [Actinomycetota bacterium]
MAAADLTGADQASAGPAAKISVEDLCAEIGASTELLAGIAGGDLSAAVPTCPDWTLRELVIHVGRAHRWAAEITKTRAAEPVPFRSVPDGKFPAEPAERTAWLKAGAERLATEVSRSGSDPVWTFAGPLPAYFWARRMAHETIVHRSDAEIALGRAPEIGGQIAADGIDEWLTVMCSLAWEGQDQRLAALPAGQAMHVHVHGANGGSAGAGEWTIRSLPGGIEVAREHGKGDAALRGQAGPVLLVLLRRLPADDPSVEVLGDPAVLDRWLENVKF